MAGSISVTGGARAAFGFLRRAWLRAAGALALAGFLGGVVGLAVRDRNLLHAGVLYGAYLLAGLMAQGALLRIACAERSPDVAARSAGLAGFQWGAVEWRLLAVVVLRGLLFSLLGALFLALLVAVYSGLAAAEARSGFAAAAQAQWRPTLDRTGWVVVWGVGLAGTVGLGWVGLRLYLAFPATVAASRVQLLSTWPLTRGRAWSILGSWLLIVMPLIGLVLAAGIGRALLAPSGSGDQHMVAGAFGMFVSLGHAFLILPLSVGLMTYLYDRLGPERAGG